MKSNLDPNTKQAKGLSTYLYEKSEHTCLIGSFTFEHKELIIFTKIAPIIGKPIQVNIAYLENDSIPLDGKVKSVELKDNKSDQLFKVGIALDETPDIIKYKLEDYFEPSQDTIRQLFLNLLNSDQAKNS